MDRRCELNSSIGEFIIGINGRPDRRTAAISASIDCESCPVQKTITINQQGATPEYLPDGTHIEDAIESRIGEAKAEIMQVCASVQSAGNGRIR